MHRIMAARGNEKITRRGKYTKIEDLIRAVCAFIVLSAAKRRIQKKAQSNQIFDTVVVIPSYAQKG